MAKYLESYTLLVHFIVIRSQVLHLGNTHLQLLESRPSQVAFKLSTIIEKSSKMLHAKFEGRSSALCRGIFRGYAAAYE